MHLKPITAYISAVARSLTHNGGEAGSNLDSGTDWKDPAYKGSHLNDSLSSLFSRYIDTRPCGITLQGRQVWDHGFQLLVGYLSRG